MVRKLLMLAVVLPLLGAGPVAAAEPDNNGPFASFYYGRGVRDNLPMIPALALHGGLRLNPFTCCNAIGLYQPLDTPDLLQEMFDAVRMHETTTGVEFQLVKHYGVQDVWETDAAYLVRLPPHSFGFFDLRGGVGGGLSYAFGETPYEGKSTIRPEKHYRLQAYFAFEIEWRLTAAPKLGLVTRIHHRSGMYGLIAPSHVGSNFIVMGLRYHY